MVHYEVDMIQGADWTPTLKWNAGGVFRAPIEEIDPGYPTRIRVTGHNLPANSPTPVIISGVEGAEILNSKDAMLLAATNDGDDYFTMPVSTRKCEWVVGTGELTFFLPTDISDMTFRAKLRARKFSDEVLHEFTTENGGIIATVEDASIQLYLSGANSANMAFTQAYLDCEAVDTTQPEGQGIQRVFSLTVNLVRESTK